MNVRKTDHALAPYLGSTSLEFFDAGLQRCRGSLVFVEEVVRSICRRERETKQETDDPTPHHTPIEQTSVHTRPMGNAKPEPATEPADGFLWTGDCSEIGRLVAEDGRGGK
jgi:hypothetical protein